MINNNELIATRIKDLRSKLGAGVREWSRELNVSPSTICAWEKGQRVPDVISCHKIIKCANLYGISINIEWLRPNSL